MIIIAFNCRARKEEKSSREDFKSRGNMKKIQVMSRGMLTTGEWCDPVSKISHHMKKGLSEEGDGHERFENSGSIWAGR